MLCSERWFDVPAALFSELRRQRQAQCRELSAIELDHDAVLLVPGFMSQAVFLSRAGHLVWDESFIDQGVPLFALACGCIITGARLTGVPGLLQLLPARGPDDFDCPSCDGTGWLDGQRYHAADGRPIHLHCQACGGLGWFASAPRAPSSRSA